MGIKVVGIGGCGCNIVDNICRTDVQDVDFALVNRDELSPYSSNAERLCVNADAKDLDKGLQILLNGIPHTLIVVAGMGGKYSAKVAAELCRLHQSITRQKALSIAFVVLPFKFETRDQKATKDLDLISEQATRVVTFDNNKLLQFENQPMAQVFRIVDQEVCNLIEAEKHSCPQTEIPY